MMNANTAMNEAIVNEANATVDNVVVDVLTRELYEQAMDGAMRVGEKKYAVISSRLLIVDRLYQRIETRSQGKLKKLDENWDYNRMDALKVVPHPEEAKFSLVDGYGRMTVGGKKKGLKKFVCEVIDGPEDPVERRKFEIDLFLGQETEAVSAVQRHNGNLYKAKCMKEEGIPFTKETKDEETAYIIQKVCDRFGVIVNPGVGAATQTRVLKAYTRAQMIVRNHGEDGFVWALQAIEDAGFSEENDGYCKFVLEMMNKLYSAYKGTVDTKTLAELLRPMSVKTFMAKATARYPEHTNITVPMTKYAMDFISEKTGKPVMYDDKGKKVIFLRTE